MSDQCNHCDGNHTEGHRVTCSWLIQDQKRATTKSDYGQSIQIEVGRLIAENERLRAEIELWKDRYEAERQAHEETVKQFDRALDSPN